MICETCSEEVQNPVEGVNVHTERGYQWHTRCARIRFVDGSPVLDVPSPGRMIPETIMRGDRNRGGANEA